MESNMLLAATTFSIRPGGTPRVKNALAQALQVPPLATGLPVTLATEIGEVNTLACLFVCTDALADLQALRDWVAAIQSGESGALLRSVSVDLFTTATEEKQLRALAAPSVQAVLLQEAIGFPVTASATTLRLSPLTGQHGVDWLLSPVGDPDEAVRMSMQTLKQPSGQLLRSRMLLPVR